MEIQNNNCQSGVNIEWSGSYPVCLYQITKGQRKEVECFSDHSGSKQLSIPTTVDISTLELEANEPAGKRVFASHNVSASYGGIELSITPDRCDIIRPATTCNARVTWSVIESYISCLYQNNTKIVCSNNGSLNIPLSALSTTFTLKDGDGATARSLVSKTVRAMRPPTGTLALASGATNPCVPTNGNTCQLAVNMQHFGGHMGVTLYKDEVAWGNLGTSGESTPFSHTTNLPVDAAGTKYSLRANYDGALYEFASLFLYPSTFVNQGYSLTSTSSECTYNPLTSSGCDLNVVWTMPSAGACIFLAGSQTGFCPDETVLSGKTTINRSEGVYLFQLRKSSSPDSELIAQVQLKSTQSQAASLYVYSNGCTAEHCLVDLNIFTNYEGNVCLYDNGVKVSSLCGLKGNNTFHNLKVATGNHKFQLYLVTAEESQKILLSEKLIDLYEPSVPYKDLVVSQCQYSGSVCSVHVSWYSYLLNTCIYSKKSNQAIYCENGEGTHTVTFEVSQATGNEFELRNHTYDDSVVLTRFVVGNSVSSAGSSGSGVNSSSSSSIAITSSWAGSSSSPSINLSGVASSFIQSLAQASDPMDDSMSESTYNGALGGIQSVGADGAFNYSIPLAIPVGINGVQPKLALNYNSNAKNGLLGWGWALNGLSVIARCNANMIRDGYAGGIQSSDNYKYCLDGQRLVEVAIGEYRLESESFLRIKKLGDYWEVITNAGLRSRYGYNADSKLSDDQSQTYAWYFDQQQDTSSNSWSINYTKTTVNGAVEHYPASISYTKNSIQGALHSIVFRYENRADSTLKYEAGVKAVIQQRLARVEIKSSNVTQYSYILSYQQPGVNYHGTVNTDPAKTSRLANVRQCFGTTTSECSAPLEFDWSEQSEGRYKFVSSGLPQEAIADEDTADDKAKLYVDANGDGVLEPYFNADSSQWVSVITTAGESFLKPSYKKMDINRDGRDDVIKEFKTQTGVEVYLSDGSQINTTPEPGFSVPAAQVSFYSSISTGCFWACITNISSGKQIAYETSYVDMNADGLPDLVRSPYHCPDGYWCTVEQSPGDISVALNTGAGFGAFVTWQNNWKGFASFCANPDHPEYCQMGIYKLSFVDINGDGLTDFMATTTYPGTSGENHLTIGYNTGAQGFTLDYLGYIGVGKFLYGDFNGDGLIDIASVPQKDGRYGVSIPATDQKITVRYGIGKKDSSSNGSIKGFTAPMDALSNIGFIKYCGNQRILSSDTAEDYCYRSVKDINSDGLDDILEWGGRLRKVCADSPAPSELSLCKKWDRTYTEFDAKAYVSLAGGFAQPVTYKDFQTLSQIGATFIPASVKNTRAAFDDYDNNGTYEDDARLKNTIESNRIKRVLESSRTIAVDYLSLASSHIYASDTSPVSLSDGEQAFNPARTMAKRLGVKEMRVTNGAGGTNKTEYKYFGAKTHGAGYGDLGFEKIEKLETVDGEEPLKTITTYYQKADSSEYKLAGKIKRQLVYVSKAGSYSLLSETRNQWKVRIYSDDVDSGYKSPHYFAYLYKSSSEQWDLDGTKIAAAQSQNQKDAIATCDALPIDPQLEGPAIVVTNAGSSADNDFTADGVLVFSQTATCDTSGSSASVQIKAMENLDIIQKGDARGLVQKKKAYAWVGSAVSSATKSAYDARTQSFTYNALGQLESKTIEPDASAAAAIKLTTTYGYNGLGSVNSVTETWDDTANDGLDVVTRTTSINESYDSAGVRTVEVTSPLNLKETTKFHSVWGLPTSEKDANGLETKRNYDALGRPDLITYADNTTTSIAYRSCNGCSAYHVNAKWYQQIKTTGSAAVRTYYDGFNREIGTRSKGLNGQDVYTLQSYNSRGSVYQTSEPFYYGGSQQTVTRTYDALGRVSNISYPDNSSEVFSYNGLRHTTTNRLSQTQTRYLNAAGWVIRSQDNTNTPVDFTYWPWGDLKTSQVNNDVKTLVNVVYDKLSRKTEMTDPNTGKTTYTYNSLGLVATQTDAKNQRTCFGYDALGRLVKRVDKADTNCTGSSTQNWFYDTSANGKGQLASMSGKSTDNSSYSESYSYTNKGLPETTSYNIGVNSYSITQHYDSFSRPLGVTYPTGYVVANSYNSYGHLNEVKDSAGTSVWKADDADALGNLKQFTLGNGVVTNQTYDVYNNRLETIRAVKGSLVIQDQKYTFDSLGNLKAREDRKNTVTQSFCYDGLNRLKAARFNGCSSANNDYVYDALGNLTSKMRDEQAQGPSLSMGYGTNGTNVAGPHAVTSASGRIYKYDAIGNLESSTKTGEATRTVQYSPFNTPTSITQGDNSSTLVYGPNQDRVKHIDKRAGATVRETHYVGGIYEEVTRNGETQKIHYVGDMALFISKGVNTSATYGYEYQHRDHIGSIVARSKGTVNSALDVDWQSNGAWGERRLLQWDGAIDDMLLPKGSARGFTDHEHLDAVGLIHMNGRVYDPELGRFMSADPFVQAPYNTQSYNRYSYVFNNPLSFTDPSGYESCGQGGCGQYYDDRPPETSPPAIGQRPSGSSMTGDAAWQYGQDWQNWASRQEIIASVIVGNWISMASINGGSYVWQGWEITLFDPSKPTVTAAVGGGGDYFDGKGLKGMAQHNEWRFFKHTQGRALAKWLDAQEKKGVHTRVVAHSWGADTAMGVAAKGHKISLLVTVDPVGMLRPNFGNVLSNTGLWVNYDSDVPRDLRYKGDGWADIGRRYNDAVANWADFHFNLTQYNHADSCFKAACDIGK